MSNALYYVVVGTIEAINQSQSQEPYLELRGRARVRAMFNLK
jgi:hypothetical protein